MQDTRTPAVSTTSGTSRRQFLLSSGAFSVAVAFGHAPQAAAQSGPLRPNAWVQVDVDGTVSIYSPAAEMGQGVRTAMPLLVAEDMDLDWSRARVLNAPAQPRLYGNPLFGGGMLAGASRTTRGYYELLRLAGHQARELMRHNAARHWQVPLAEVTTEPHHAVHAATGRKLGYGAIAAFAEVPADFPKSVREQLKPSSAFRLIGKDTPRVDVPEKTTGKAVYGIDVKLPGMLYGSILRAPVQGEKPRMVDDTAARQVPGVRNVVTLPHGVAVIATDYWSALKARNALKVEWTDAAPARRYTSDTVLGEYKTRAASTETGVEYVRTGDTAAALQAAHKVVRSTYTCQHVAHACMEPVNATARITGDKLEIWAPTQSPTFCFIAAGQAGFKAENTTIHTTMLGGGFGRKTEADFVLDAIQVATAVPGVAVKVIWTREDDIRSDKHRPLVAQHLTGAIDAKGQVTAMAHRVVAESIYGRAMPANLERAKGYDSPVCEGGDIITYQVPNRSLAYLREQRGVDVGFWRAVGPGYTKFAVEGMMDELAALAGQDPVAFRLAQLGSQPAAAAVIRSTAAMAGWGRTPAAGRALGIGYSDAWEAHCAMVSEVSIDRQSGRIRVHNVWCAVDPGIALQPRNIEVQMESSVMYGLSALLGEQVKFDRGVPQATNFHDYPLLRMHEAPQVHVKVQPSGGKPSGIGEVGLPPLAPSVAGALFKLTGKRLRDLPFDPQALRS